MSRKKMEWQWEVLDQFTSRIKVIGGWIVNHGSHTNKGSIADSLVFIPDRDHEWTIVAAVKEEAPKPTVQSSDFDPKK